MTTRTEKDGKQMKESQIEERVCKWAVNNGWLAMKFTSPARRCVPDRIFIKEGRVVFIEFKAPKGKLTNGQTREIGRLRDAGAEVHVCYGITEAKDALLWGDW